MWLQYHLMITCCSVDLQLVLSVVTSIDDKQNMGWINKHSFLPSSFGITLWHFRLRMLTMCISIRRWYWCPLMVQMYILSITSVVGLGWLLKKTSSWPLGCLLQVDNQLLKISIQCHRCPYICFLNCSRKQTNTWRLYICRINADFS